MNNNTTSGKLITLEGIEGVGKSTQMNFLAQMLKESHIDFIRTREPGGTKMAEKIRHILLETTEDETLFPKTEALLLYAGRCQHVGHVIQPALLQGKWVLCDRFFDATLAYQGGGREMPLDEIDQLNQWVLGSFKPNYTIILDAPVKLAMSRLQGRQALDRFEQETFAFFERIRTAYLTLAKREPKRFFVVDASGSIAEVQAQLRTLIQKIMAA